MLQESNIHEGTSTLVAENFAATVAHLQAAVRHYQAAARHYEVSDIEKALLSSATAERHIRLAQHTQDFLNTQRYMKGESTISVFAYL